MNVSFSQTNIAGTCLPPVFMPLDHHIVMTHLIARHKQTSIRQKIALHNSGARHHRNAYEIITYSIPHGNVPGFYHRRDNHVNHVPPPPPTATCYFDDGAPLIAKKFLPTAKHVTSYSALRLEIDAGQFPRLAVISFFFTLTTVLIDVSQKRKFASSLHVPDTTTSRP